MSIGGFKDGAYGELTLEAMHLHGKSETYREGYWRGRVTGNEGVVNEQARYAARVGGDYLNGFIMGKAVRAAGPQVVLGRHTGSYRDPDLSQQWLREAEWKAKQRGIGALSYASDLRKITLRLIAEVKRLRGWA